MPRYPLVHPPPPTPEEIEATKRRRELRRWKPKGPFPFFALPFELRRQILSVLLVLDTVVDLDPTNHRVIGKRLQILQTSRRMHEEASRVFYGQNIFRLFPIHKEFFKTEDILLTRLPVRYRAIITRLDLRLGPHWADPPRCWTLGFGQSRGGRKRDKSGLEDCKSLWQLKVFVEVDPSHPIFNGWRINEAFYTEFCGGLLKRICSLAPELENVEFDGWESVKLAGPLMTELRWEARVAGKRISYGPERGWGEEAKRLSEAASAIHTPLLAPAEGLESAVAAISLQA